MVRNIVVLVLVASFLAGCAFGRKQDYRRAQLTLPYSGKERLAVGVQDRRPYVLDQKTEEDYVGMQRGGYGNPFDVTTASKKPLADEMANLIADALRKSGAKAVSVRLAPSLNQTQVISALKAANSDKSLVLTLHDWESDTYAGTELRYDVEMRVLNRDGTVLASKKASGTDQLGAGFWDPQGVAQEGTPLVFKKQIEQLYNGDIAKALGRTETR